MNNKRYDRKFLRKHFSTNIWVSNDGKHAERDITRKNGTDDILVYNIYVDKRGRAYIYDSYKGICYLDGMVLTCFRGREPQDGKKYFPYHKDGNIQNSLISNLEWREETPDAIAEIDKLAKEAWYKHRKIRVLKDGTITQNGNKLPLIDYIYDSDMAWTYHKPYHWIRFQEKNRWGMNEDRQKHVDEIFEDFGFIEGDKREFSNPVILHRNNDYEDYSKGNLQWCDSSDQRYEGFDKIRHDAVMTKDRKSNKLVNEREWNVIYNGHEPYQDWSDTPKP